MVSDRHRRPARGFLAGLWAASVLAGAPLAAAPWLVINEVHYHPPGGDDEEFIEILSREPPRVDLTDWILEGEVDFRFPPGTVLQTGEFLVLARNPEVCRERHRGRGRILGPWQGRLDNSSGELILRNAAGAIHCQVRYGSRGRWPVSPDGTGHTLSLLDPFLDPSNPLNWSPSRATGGTPGRPNFPREAVVGLPLVKVWAPWKYWRGKTAPPAGWQATAFDDSTWESGASGLGFGDDDDATIIEDMRGNYLSLFARHAFEAPAALSRRLIFSIDYDDGFVAFLNGKEIARENLGAVGSDHPFDQPASRLREAGVSVEYDLGPASALLVPGKNVLAVAVHNYNLKSADLSLIPVLELREGASGLTGPARPLLNEVRRGSDPAQNFVEVHNSGATAVNLNGWFLSDDPKKLQQWRISAQAEIPPGGFLALSPREVGGALPLGGDSLLTLTEPAGRRVADALPLPGGGKKGKKDAAGEKVQEPASPAEFHFGRIPDGSGDFLFLDTPTPGQTNEAPPASRLVINEILYHPITGKVEDEFVEIFNPGSEAVALAGYRLAGGIAFEFPAGATLPAGGYLVVAKDPGELGKKYGLAKAKLTGPFEGQLSDGGESLTLRDARGNLVDRVAYGDRSPWPATADGLGASLELIDPALDNSLAGSWAASDDQSKAKWEAFAYEKEHLLFENRNLAEFQFLLLNQGECLIDDVRIQGVFEENFERGGASWIPLGTHERSGVQPESTTGRNQAYRIVSEGRGNARNNYVSRDLMGGITPGKRYKVSFRAKWRQGSPLLLSRTPGQGMARVHRLAIPQKLGTPGAENSARRKDPPPVVGSPVQDPVSPGTGQPVEIAVPISSVAPLRAAVLHYRPPGDAGYTPIPLAEKPGAAGAAGGARLFTGTIPAQPAGKVEFYLTATDDRGASGTFPAGAPERVALYAVGLAPSPKFPTYTVLISDAEWDRYQKRPRMSNRLIDASLLYGDSRILYNVGLRRRGSPFTRNVRNWRVVFGAERLDGRGTLTLDGQNGDGTKLNERLTFWLVDQLRAPNARQQYVYLRIFGVEEGIFEDVEKIDRDYLARWLDTPPPPEIAAPLKTPGQRRSPSRQKAALDRAEGNLHKVDDYWELLPNQERFYRQANFLFQGLDPEAYRWNFPPRCNALDEDFTPLIQLIQLFDQRSSADKVFDERLESMVEVDEWLRVLAARTLVDDWDTVGRERGKNAFIYRSPSDGRWRLLPWDCDLSFRDPNSALFSDQFEGIRRILKRPHYRRRFLGYLGYLAERKFEPEYLAGILDDLKKLTGAVTKPYADFAAVRRDVVLREVPRGGGLRIAANRRIAGQAGKPDLVRVSGLASSPRVMRLRLGGREGKVRWMGDGTFEAEFLIGPEGGDLVLEGMEVGGEGVAREKVAVRERKGALALAPVDGGLERARELVWAEVPEEPLAVAAAETPPSPGPASTAAPPPETKSPKEEEKTAPAVVPTDAVPTAVATTAVAPATESGAAPDKPGATGTPAPAPSAGLPPARADFTSGSRPEAKKIRKAAEPAPPVAESLPSAPVAAPAPAGGRGFPLWILAGAGVSLLSIAGGAAFIWLRRRQGGSSLSIVEESLEAICGEPFPQAAQALKRLGREGRESVPRLLQALEDRRPTPFHRIKQSPEGLTATPSPPGSPGTIEVRHVAVLLLQHHIGRPPVEKPTRMHWLAHWNDLQRAQSPPGAKGDSRIKPVQ